MTKRITALLIAVLLPITFILSGCGSKELTPQEYRDQMYDNFTQYLETLREISGVQAEVSTVEELRERQKEAGQLCRNAEMILNLYKEMTPPSQFADKHKKLLTAVESEKGFLQAVEKVFTAASADELSKNKKEADTFFDGIPEKQQFPAVFLELFLEVQSAVGE